MARGKSGRIVLEIEPELKREIYSALEISQKTMKEWFVREARTLIYGSKQPSQFDDSESSASSNKHKGEK